MLATEAENSSSNWTTSMSSGWSGQTATEDNFPQWTANGGSRWACVSNLQSGLDINHIDLNSTSLMDLEKWAQNNNFDLSASCLSDLQSWLQNHTHQFSGNGLADLENSLQRDEQMNQDGNGNIGLETDNEPEREIDDEQEIQAVPEPGLTALLANGAMLIGSSFLRRRK
jgi:hypothetical protein